MAEEDLIFGKNRHMFGGIEPSNMLKFTAVENRLDDGGVNVRIEAKLPKDTIIDGQTLCTVAGAVIRRKVDGYPADEFDGELVATIASDGIIYDNSYDARSNCFYAAFPFTTQGVYNRNSANRSMYVPTGNPYFYGYDINLDDSNPDTRVTYPVGVHNTAYDKAYMNFKAGVFNYGDWPSAPGSKFMPKPCMLTYAGVVDHYLNPNDYTKKEDGTASQVANSSFGGNAMMEWPKIFTKRWEEDGVYKFRCCDVKLDSDYECWCNYDRYKRKIEHFYTPIYFGSNVSNKMRSISGQANSVSKTAVAEIALATANGSEWYTEVFADRLLIQDLLVLIGKTTNCQESFGKGVCGLPSFNGTPIGQGTMDSKGLFWGSDNSTFGVKVFGMENWWGNLERRTAGWILDQGVQKVRIIQEQGLMSYNTTGYAYTTISGADIDIEKNIYGYIDRMKTEAFGRLPIAADGSGSTYEADRISFGNVPISYPRFGGNYYDSLAAGPFAVTITNADNSTSGCGAAVSCKPLR